MLETTSQIRVHKRYASTSLITGANRHGGPSFQNEIPSRLVVLGDIQNNPRCKVGEWLNNQPWFIAGISAHTPRWSALPTEPPYFLWLLVVIPYHSPLIDHSSSIRWILCIPSDEYPIIHHGSTIMVNPMVFEYREPLDGSNIKYPTKRFK